MNSLQSNMPYGWNIFQGGHAYEAYKNEVIIPLLNKGTWTGEDYITAVSNTILKHGKAEAGKVINDYIYKPVNKPHFWDVEYNDFSIMFDNIQASNTFNNWHKDIKRHYIYVAKGVAYEEQIAKEQPTWLKSDKDMDYYGGIDFVDEENKILYSVKCTKSLEARHLKAINEYFKQADLNKKWNEYAIKVLWFDTVNNNKIIVDCGHVSDIGVKYERSIIR